MSGPGPSFFTAVNQRQGPTGTPFLNFGFVALDGDGRPRQGRRSAGATSVALLRTVLTGVEVDGRLLVEIGCGRGGNLRWLSRHRRPGPMIGLDLSPAATDAARHNAGVAVGVADALTLPLRSASVGVVLNVESSCLYEDQAAFYAEVARVLTVGGTFVYADVLPRSLAAALPDHLGAQGIEVAAVEDVTANVRASVTARRAEAPPGPAADFLAWFGERLAAGDLAYVHLTGRRRAGPGGDPPALPPDALGELRSFVAEALARAQPAA